jgi:CheY-like chemotaxis protein
MILVVDDDPDLLISMKDLLGEKYRVLTARDGYDAVQIAGEKKPNLILLDLNLPVLDGFSVLMMLKSDDHTRPIPVVILSATREKSKIIRAQQEGATGYITKPFDPEQVYTKIEKLVSSKGMEKSC